MLRLASLDDAAAVADLHRRVVRACLPYLPELHSSEEDLAFFSHHFMHDNEVWVWAEDSILGYCGFRPGWLSHLYVDPARHGQGIGTALLAKAMEGQTSMRLWVFQRNLPAIHFYERHGFERLRATDGADNEEREPDYEYGWRASS